MKILEIRECRSPICPFFKEIVNDETDTIGLCDHEKRYISKLDQSNCKHGEWFETDIQFVEGSFPEWCPLLNQIDHGDIWEVS